jgi:S1-C subfamily serine protease
MSTFVMVMAAGMMLGDGSEKVSGEIKDETAQMEATIWEKLGLKLCQVDREAVCTVFPTLNGGVKAMAVRGGSPAENAGIQRGDILIGLHTWEILSLEHVIWVLDRDDLMKLMPIRFCVVRDNHNRLLGGRIKINLD